MAFLDGIFGPRILSDRLNCSLNNLVFSVTLLFTPAVKGHPRTPMGPQQPGPHSMRLLAAWTHEGDQHCLFTQNFILLCRLTSTKDFPQPCSTWSVQLRTSLMTSTTTTKARSEGLFATWRRGPGPAWRSWVAPLRGGGSELICEFWPKFVIWPLFAFMH